MDSERWRTVKALFDQAIELDPVDRLSFLDSECGEDMDLRREVGSLLDAHQNASASFLNVPTGSFLAAAATPARNRRIGAYQIVEEIGHGGMGEVYRALRVDGQYRKEVAIKVVHGGFSSRSIDERFWNERQILATLDHPNIARLLDGGTTEDGIPYLVMELIDGAHITDFCECHKFDIRERLNLFLQTCSAVQYAHQQLVIHRDIKPANMLVTSDGTLKLLDFGIAKMLNLSNSQESGATLTGLRVLTPRYASPEQIQGLAMTTASDVYSLGVVLYELLTGQSPYTTSSHSPSEIANSVCNEEPAKASTVADVSLRKRLQGDLDNILAMALRKDPRRRYVSVEQFAEDIRRHLENIPIRAARESVGYRASKFIARHKTAVTASALTAILLLITFAAALYEARVARLERARAERRFNDVRKLANSLMFEVHDSIKDLPGTTNARKILVNRSLEYLNSLAQESSGDVALQRELAAAYDRVGGLLGYAGAANLGDFNGALGAYKKALNIREAAAKANPDDVQVQGDLLSDYFHLSFVLDDQGDDQGALAMLRAGLPIAETLAKKHDEPKYKDWWAGLYWKSGYILARIGNYAEALANYRQAASIRESIGTQGLSNPVIRTHLVADYLGVGSGLRNTGDLNGALSQTLKGVQMMEKLRDADPSNATLRAYLGEAYNELAETYDGLQQYTSALSYASQATVAFQRLLENDRENWLARINLASSQVQTGTVLIHLKQYSRAEASIRQAIIIYESNPSRSPNDTAARADAYSALASGYLAWARANKSRDVRRRKLLQAKEWYEKALALLHERTIGSPEHWRQQLTTAGAGLSQCEAALAKLAST